MKKNIVILMLSTLGLLCSNSVLADSFSNATTEVWNGAVNNTIDKAANEINGNIQHSVDSVLQKKENINKAMNVQTGNAFQQGYISEEMRILKLKEEEKIKNSKNPRQKGEQVQVLQEKNPVGKNKHYKQWLNNWAYILEDVGVTQEKTYFEANRLNKEDFEEWANETLQKFK